MDAVPARDLGLRQALACIVGDAHVLSPDDGVVHLSDWSGRFRGDASCVVRPKTTAEVAAVVSLCAHRQVPVVPQGGNTGVCGGAIPLPGSEAVVVSLQRLSAIRSVDQAGGTIVADAGCVLADIQGEARRRGLLFPLTLGAEGSCQIGGNVSTNAGGIAALRYGSMRDLVLGLEVVLPDGSVWDGLRTLRKDNTGYNLRDLFIGAEGTLGIITGCALRLVPLPASDHLAWIAVDDVDTAVRLLNAAQARFGAGLAAFELVSGPLMRLVCNRFADRGSLFPEMPPWLVLVHVVDQAHEPEAETRFTEALDELIRHHGGSDAVVARSTAQSEAFWRLRHGVTEANRARGFNVTHDIAVPVARLAEFVAAADAICARRFPDAEIYSVSHLGDGNCHYTVTIPGHLVATCPDTTAFASQVTEIIHELAMEMDGSFAAEHGIGQRHLASLARYKSQVELDLFARIKAALDPQGILNPGKVVPGPHADARQVEEER